MAQDAGSWRAGFDFSQSNGLTAGHPEHHGIAPDGSEIEVPLHAHHVEMDLTRLELSLSRTFDDTWDAVIRIPWLIKDQTSRVNFIAPMTPEEREAALRNSYIHHRSETYEGFGDAELTVGWRKAGLFGEGSILRLSAGLTLPFGDTEANPWALGDDGLRHTHIQMGNGTFDPVLDFYAGVPLSGGWAFSLYGKARIPLYENSEGFLGSPEIIVIPRVTWLPNKSLSLSAGLTATYLGYSYWDSERDDDSGQFTLNAGLSAGYKLSETVTGSAGFLFPIHTRSYSGGGDAYDPAPVFTVSIAKQF